MRVALNLSDIILDTTVMIRAGVSSRMQDGLASTEQEALCNALYESVNIALSRGKFFNEKLISSLKELSNVEYYILCNPTEESLAFAVADILCAEYDLTIVDVFAEYFEDMEEYITDIGINLVVTNDMRLLSAACDCSCKVIGYGLYNVELPIAFTKDISSVISRIKEAAMDIKEED